MDVADIFIPPVYIIIIMTIAFRVRRTNLKNENIRKYFVPGLGVKIFGAYASALIYMYYYGSGDTFHYFEDSQKFWLALFDSPVTWWKMMMLDGGQYEPDAYYYTRYIVYFRNPTAYFVVKVASLVSLLCFNNYLTIAVLFAAFSFVGVWGLFVTLVDIYPKLHRKLAIAVLFIPSVFFWGSGLFKDTITFGCLGLLTYSFYHLFIKQERLFLNIISIIFCSYMIAQIKMYILLSFAPGLFFWLFLTYRNRFKTAFLRNASTPLFIIVSAVASYFFIVELGQESSKFSVENMTSTATTMQTWHSYISEKEGGSGYNLGDFEPTLGGMISVFPKAVNITFFRPYLWEANNPVMLLASLESTAILILTIYILIQAKVFPVIRIIYRNPIVFSSVFFAIMFGFAVGFSSYNFGALSRYKIPCLPFYVSALFMIQYHSQQARQSKFGSIRGIIDEEQEEDLQISEKEEKEEEEFERRPFPFPRGS